MNAQEKFLLLKTVQENNILPITSACNMSCQFCSHRNNPPGIQVYRFGHLQLDLIRELIDYLPEEGPIILGESATRIIEGDPFMHPRFRVIIGILRERWPERDIKLTTNGSYLSEEMVKFLAEQEPLELNISVNCASPEERVFLMKDPFPENVFRALNYLRKYKINYNGSIVAMPHLMGWGSLTRTLDLLEDFQPSTVRVFMPGFTDYTDDQLIFTHDLYPRLQNFIEENRKRYSFPLLLEPPLLVNFKIMIKGIISGTPAARAGLSTGDQIIKINGEKPLTRVEAFHSLSRIASPDLTIERKDQQLNIKLLKQKEERPGIVLDYDLSSQDIIRLKQVITKYQDRNIVIITSLLARYLIQELLEMITSEPERQNIDLLPVKSKYFGGSIMAAGLLVISDIISALKEKDYNHYQLIILPGIIFDIFGKDLTGKGYELITEILGIEVEII